MGLPMLVTTAVNEMMSGACLSLQLNPLMTQGQIEALEAHASDEVKALYLPKLISGEWCGTMNLTEPQAGSDVGALRTKAEPLGDGTYAVTGQKIYISWGDNDFTENVCHLVLARLPDAGEGTRGISLFMVPKRLPDEDGNAGVANDLRVVSLEHKLGLHASPTAVMEYSGAKGWLVGEPHRGMAAMFTMMNNARLGVGVQGIGVAEGAYQHALAYAMERRQGRAEGSGAIVEHADVRRMLTRMKADTQGARAIALACAQAIDMGVATGEHAWRARAALLTPIAKAWGTEVGLLVAGEGIQVHGGMGFVEETGAAQYLRDVRVTAIYEGTNGIQAMDLVGRKMADGGEAAVALIEEIERGAEAARARMDGMAEAVWQAAAELRETTEWLVAQEPRDRFAGAVPYLRAFARVLGGHFHLLSAMAEEGEGPRTHLATFYMGRMLPEHGACWRRPGPAPRGSTPWGWTTWRREGGPGTDPPRRGLGGLPPVVVALAGAPSRPAARPSGAGRAGWRTERAHGGRSRRARRGGGTGGNSDAARSEADRSWPSLRHRTLPASRRYAGGDPSSGAEPVPERRRLQAVRRTLRPPRAPASGGRRDGGTDRGGAERLRRRRVRGRDPLSVRGAAGGGRGDRGRAGPPVDAAAAAHAARPCQRLRDRGRGRLDDRGHRPRHGADPGDLGAAPRRSAGRSAHRPGARHAPSSRPCGLGRMVPGGARGRTPDDAHRLADGADARARRAAGAGAGDAEVLAPLGHGRGALRGTRRRAALQLRRRGGAAAAGLPAAPGRRAPAARRARLDGAEPARATRPSRRRCGPRATPS